MDAFEAISLPEPSPATTKKYFRLAEANRALTLVRRIVADIVAEYRRLRELHETHRAFDARGDVPAAERAREEYAAVTDHLAELREELEEIGCELKDYEQGVVDFPARLDGREVLLCWKLGENRIEHWHELEATIAERQPMLEHWGYRAENGE